MEGLPHSVLKIIIILPSSRSLVIKSGDPQTTVLSSCPSVLPLLELSLRAVHNLIIKNNDLYNNIITVTLIIIPGSVLVQSMVESLINHFSTICCFNY